jgi:di/tricarboxylate transporter
MIRTSGLFLPAVNERMTGNAGKTDCLNCKAAPFMRRLVVISEESIIMIMQVVSLLCLVGAIIFGFVGKKNVGIVSLGLALVLGMYGGMDAKAIYAGFPSKLFLTLLGTMFFFSLLQENKTLEKISEWMTGLCGTKVFLVPIIIYLVSFILSAAGPGAISVQTVMVLFAVPMAIGMGADPVLMGVMAILGAVGGTASPIALTGIIVSDLLSAMDITGKGMQIFLGVSIANVVCAVVVYILLKGWKMKGKAAENCTEKKNVTFERTHIISTLMLLVMVVLVVGFSFDVGLVCLTLAFIMTIFNLADEKKAIKAIPWSTLILIAGVSVLMNITQTMGGINLLADILASMMNKLTAAPIMGLTGGIMSWFSSANGVVFPTLIPTVPDIASQVGGASIIQMVVAIVCSATVAGISPLSTGGSLVLASYAQEMEGDEKSHSGVFIRLFGISAICVLTVFVMTLIGLLKFLG